ncbi:glycosyltransferase family 2 protein [Vulcanimicrobium alpinum]|uniref:glycosyltransferase family 2 protein n=1 Tax=Vulcanimicrobium alpinum TaxID=3016050 RepID=UPI00295EA7C7|nr:glycosyltransferase [Vulcanimicrobium alpinum]
MPVSVVIPAYNAESFIGAAIESVRVQTSLPAEVIVVDDGSTDRTAEIASQAGARVVTQRNSGPSAARNAGVDAASSPWIAFLDADDRWAPDKLESQSAAISRWPDLGFCISDYAVVQPGGIVEASLCEDPDYRTIGREAIAGAAVRFERSSFLRAFIRSMFLRQSSALVKRELFLQSGGYDSRFRLAEDYDLFLRLASVAPAAAIERPLVEYVRSADSLSADRLAEIWSIDALWEWILAAPERYPEPIGELVALQRAATLRRGVRIAMRQGRFAEAQPFLEKLRAIDGSRSTVALDMLLGALRSPLGRPLHRAARTIWRLRPRGAGARS